MNGTRIGRFLTIGLVLGAMGSASLLLGQDRPLVKVVATGGTIAHLGGNNRIPFEEVIADIQRNFAETRPLLDSIDIEVDNVLMKGSGGITGEEVLDIVRSVQEAVADPRVRGVIVTHGTTTSEETAYYLHLLIRTTKPIVLTNSQRLHGLVGNDGDRNFIESLEVVLSPEAVGKGVMIVHNSSINSAREVIKGSYRPGGFHSGEFGLLGVIGAESALRARERAKVVSFYREPTRRHTNASEFDLDSITALPKVEVIIAHRDAEPSLARVAVENGAHLFIREPLCRSDHRVGQPSLLHTPLSVEQNKCTLRKTNLFLLKGTYTIRKHFRKHRDHSTRKVDTVRTMAGFPIQLFAFNDEVGDVGNVHAEFHKPSGLYFERNSIVEIARIHWINRDDSQRTKIFPIFRRRSWIECLRNASRFRKNVIFKFARQIVLLDDAECFDSRLTARTEHAEQDTPSFLVANGVLSDVDNNLIPYLGILSAGIVDLDPNMEHVTVGNDKPMATSSMQLANNRWVLPL